MRGEQRLREHVLNANTPRKAMTTAWFTALPTPSAPPDAVIPLYEQTIAMIAPNRVVFTTDPQRSTTDAFVSSVAKNGPSGAPNVSVANTPPKMPNSSA